MLCRIETKLMNKFNERKEGEKRKEKTRAMHHHHVHDHPVKQPVLYKSKERKPIPSVFSTSHPHNHTSHSLPKQPLRPPNLLHLPKTRPRLPPIPNPTALSLPHSDTRISIPLPLPPLLLRTSQSHLLLHTLHPLLIPLADHHIFTFRACEA